MSLHYGLDKSPKKTENLPIIQYFISYFKISTSKIFLETMGFKEKEVCLLICISMFDVGRTDIQALDDREGIQ